MFSKYYDMSIFIYLQVQFYTYDNGNKTKIVFYNYKGEKMFSKTYDMSISINWQVKCYTYSNGNKTKKISTILKVKRCFPELMICLSL